MSMILKNVIKKTLEWIVIIYNIVARKIIEDDVLRREKSMKLLYFLKRMFVLEKRKKNILERIRNSEVYSMYSMVPPGTRRYYVVMMILNTTALWCEHKKGDDLNCN